MHIHEKEYVQQTKLSEEYVHNAKAAEKGIRFQAMLELEDAIISNMQFPICSFITLRVLKHIVFPPFSPPSPPANIQYTILACRHCNVHMCCIHFSNKEKRRGCGGIGVVWGRHVSFVFTHTQTCQIDTLFFHPLQHSAAHHASVSCVTCSFSKISYEHLSRLQGWREATME